MTLRDKGILIIAVLAAINGLVAWYAAEWQLFGLLAGVLGGAITGILIIILVPLALRLVGRLLGQ
jgi:uncharacterized membrane-anchored protein